MSNTYTQLYIHCVFAVKYRMAKAAIAHNRKSDVMLLANTYSTHVLPIKRGEVFAEKYGKAA